MTNTNITYTQQGDYLLPDLKLPEQPKVEIGVFGKRRLRYLERNRKILYTNLLTKGKLTAYLADIDEQAENMFDRLVRQLAEREGVTEQLKANNQMLWVKVVPDQMIAEALNNVGKRHVSYVGNPKLMNNVMAEIIISLPSSENERQLISAFFNKIDSLITLHQRKKR